ncbi:MAG: hypothetical protein RMK01_09030 [Thermomicrobium sp.]|nr:hypothetical protein [Thermomicrobium sp.]MDW8060204.1 hypothetical protein [Thermomicrobium sp.]
MDWARISWILWLAMLLCAVPIAAIELIRGRRPRESGPSRWYRRVIGGVVSVLGLGLLVSSLRTGPQTSMQDPYFALSQLIFTGYFLWYWIRLVLRSGRGRDKRNVTPPAA